MTTNVHRLDHDEHDHAPGVPWSALLKALLLAALGAYLISLAISGKLINYVSPQTAWLTWAAVAMFLLLALVQAAAGFAAWPRAAAEQEHDHHTHDHHAHETHDAHAGHAHGTLAWPALVIIALPLLIGGLVPSRPLGAAAFDA